MDIMLSSRMTGFMSDSGSVLYSFFFFETGDFDVTIPVEGEISEVIVKTCTDERTVWKKWNSMVFISQQSVTVYILYRW